MQTEQFINRILIAEDDPISLKVLKTKLENWGFEIVITTDGSEALEQLNLPDSPKIAILDWMMPKMNGVEVCRQFRKVKTSNPAYLILLTSLDRKSDVVKGLDAGADDYIIKPFDNEELLARIGAGKRIIKLQTELANRVKELKDALNHITTLQGNIPICMHCKKIRDDKDAWKQMEIYITEHTEAQFSHGICPTCERKQRNFQKYSSIK